MPMVRDPSANFRRRIAPEALLDLVRSVALELHPQGVGRAGLSLDSSLERDFGLDSLGRVEMLARLERTFGISLNEQAVAAAESPRDLLRAAKAAGASLVERREPVSRPLIDTGAGEPVEAHTLKEVLDWHTDRHPEQVHIELYDDDGSVSSITYGDLRTSAGMVASGLMQRGLQTGETVALMLPTGRDYLDALYGTLLAGGVPVPLYPPVRPSQLEDHLRRQTAILANARTRILVSFDRARPLLRLVASGAPDMHTVVTVDELRQDGPECRVAPAGHDTALLQYTSGSTGQPKGVVLNHANILANLRASGYATAIGPSDTFISWLPLYHDMGLIGACFGTLYFGFPLVLMSPLSFLTRPHRWLWAIHRHHGTITAAPNFAYELCLHRIDDRDLEGLDLGSLRLAFNGAEPVSPKSISEFSKRFAAHGFRPGAMYPVYGLAENTVAMAFPPVGREPVIDSVDRERFTRTGRASPAGPGERAPLSFVSCGMPIPGHEFRIIDSSGSELGERREGRLQFRGPSATSGYFRNPEANRRLFHGDWLDTGDLAYIAGGELYLTGRTKDIVIRAGRNIYPHELEEAIGEIPGVRKGCVAVFGSPDPGSGTERLVVVAESRAMAEDVRNDLARKITNLAVDLVGLPPDEVLVVPPHTVLKTSSGKLRRAAGRDLYEQGRIGQAGRAVWLQVTRVALSTVRPRLRRARQATGDLLYGLYSWLIAGLATPVLWSTAVLMPGAHRRWRMVAAGLRTLARLTATPLTVHGLEHLPGDRPFVVAANHASYLDSLILPAVLPCRLAYVAKREFLDNLFTRIPLKRLGVLFAERWDAERGAEDTENLLAELRSGRSLAFFPEGTFDRSPGLMPFRMGAFVVASQAGVPVVPVIIRGSRAKLRAYQWRPGRGAVSVLVLPPVSPGGPEWSDAIALRDTVRDDILRFCGEPDLAVPRG